jgi:Fusaric acid resistance protein-like
MLCMLPMAVAYFTGHKDLVVPFGQGGFFYSMMPLQAKTVGRIMSLVLLLGLGMGFYLLGGNIVHNFWLSLFITFVVSIAVGLLSGYQIVMPLAFTFVTLYSAGLNASSSDKAHSNFLAFVVIFIWCGLVSMPPIWKGISFAKLKILDTEENFVTGVRLGIGTTIALLIANIFGFAKYGWPVSAVGSIVRFNEAESKKRAMGRVIGTIGGSILAIITFLFVSSAGGLILLAYLYGMLQALFSKDFIGRTVFFYTATIIILYSLNDIGVANTVAMQRVAYNLVGILIGVAVVMYQFPFVTKKVDALVRTFWRAGAEKQVPSEVTREK